MDDTLATPYAAGMTNPERPDETARRAALVELDRLRHDGDALGGTITRLMRRAGMHFGGGDADTANDRIEIWGRRIGRALSVVALVALCVYLYATLLR